MGSIPINVYEVIGRETNLLPFEALLEPEMRREVLGRPVSIQNLQPTR
jgi:hypothetical protein